MSAAEQSAKSRVRIVIADDHPAIRLTVKRLLGTQPGFEIVAEVHDGIQAIREVEALKPDVVVLDIFMPNMSGFEVARYLRNRHSDSAIVILSSHKNDRFISEARRVGAQAYVQKSGAVRGLVQAIESAVSGGEFFLAE